VSNILVNGLFCSSVFFSAFYRATACNTTHRYSDEKAVCLSVCLSNAWIVTKRKFRLYSYITWKITHPGLLIEKWLVKSTTVTWNFASNWPRWSENADFQSIFVHSASAVTPSGRSLINTNRKFTTRFPMSLRWTTYTLRLSPQRGLKNAKRPISV